MWKGYSAGVYFYNEDPIETCIETDENGIDALYYKGERFKEFKGDERSVAISGTCVGLTSSSSAPIIEVEATIARYCGEYMNTPSGEVLLESALARCAAEQTCELKVNNPVELPSLVKLEDSPDWESALDPRFMIERHYRSDDALFQRDWNGARGQADGFASVWIMRYNDVFDAATRQNPFDPADDRLLVPVRKANGDLTYFVSLSADGVSYPAISKQHQSTLVRSANGLQFVLDDGSGVLRTFVRSSASLGLTFLTRDVVWPDGYKISFERTGLQLTRMYDNKGQSASFVYSGSVVPGATRSYIAEIVLSFTAPGTTLAVETGRLQYQYIATAARGLAAPVLSSVNYTASGATVPTPIYHYTYVTNASPALPVWPPLLTGISDGSTDTAGALQY